MSTLSTNSKKCFEYQRKGTDFNETMYQQDPAVEQHFIGHKGPITSLSFSPNGTQLLSSSQDKSFMKWDLTSSKGSLRYRAEPVPVTSVTFSPSGNLIASSQSQFVRLWMATIQGKSVEFKAHTSTVRSVRFSPDGHHLLTASVDKTLKLWKTSIRKFVSSFVGHTNWVRIGNYSPDGNLIVSCGDDKTIRLWDPKTSKPVHTFYEIKDSARFVDFHPSGTYIGVAMGKDVLKIYDIRILKLIQYYPCHSGPVNSLSFHPNGNYLITGGEDRTSKVIDLREGRAILSLEGHNDSVTAVSFNPTGCHFATASTDKNIFVWKTNLDIVRGKVKSLRNGFDFGMVGISKESPRNIHGTNNISDNEGYSPKDYEDQTSANQDENSYSQASIRNSVTASDYEVVEENKSVSDEYFEKLKYCFEADKENIDASNSKDEHDCQPAAVSISKLAANINNLNRRLAEIEEKISILEVQHPCR